jgi:transposase
VRILYCPRAQTAVFGILAQYRMIVLMTIQLEFSPEIQAALNYERYHHPVPLVQRRMETVWLKSHDLPHEMISRLAGVSENTMREHFRLYQEGGIERLKEVRFYHPESELQAHTSSLEAHFRDHPPATVKEAMSAIETLTGIKRSQTQVRQFLQKLGLRCRKVGMVPAKADPDEQATYLREQIEPRLAEAQAGKRAVFFVDAAHFVLAAFLGFLWSFTRVFIRAPAGRQRFNILGALNATTHELVTVTNATYITATEVCELLRKLAALNLGLPITVFLDNARYQKCALVMSVAASLNIELCYLPVYSPNLNLIERLWKFVKKDCLYSKYYADFAKFKAAIVNCLNQTHTTHKATLDSLLALHFQLFEKAQFVTV